MLPFANRRESYSPVLRLGVFLPGLIDETAPLGQRASPPAQKLAAPRTNRPIPAVTFRKETGLEPFVPQRVCALAS